MSIGIQLPRPLPAGGRSWDYIQTLRKEVAAAASNGTAEGSIGPVPAGQMWRIERISVQASQAGTSFVAYFNDALPQRVADSTGAGSADVADEHQPIVLNEADELLLVWSNCPANTMTYANLQVAIYQLRQG